MAEEDKVFQNKVKYKGPFDFKEFYKFCYEWIINETGLTVFSEDKYKEKLVGDVKNIEIEWTATRELTDYFKFKGSIAFKIIGLANVEITQNGKKVKTNTGEIEITVKGILLKDYKGKFEKTGFLKFLRGIYEKMIIPSRIEQFETKINEDCTDFLAQAKAYLDLEGKR